MKKLLSALVITVFTTNASLASQQPVVKHAWESFSLDEIELTPSCFYDAMQRHGSYVLSLDIDKLLSSTLKGVGLEPKATTYGGWEKGVGCTYGHYLSACAMYYAATKDTKYVDRIDYMLSELNRCREKAPQRWWLETRVLRGMKTLRDGRMALTGPDETQQPWSFNDTGNSWYAVHKVLAGLRDVYLYTGNQLAFDMWRELSDTISLYINNSNRDLIQAMLAVEHGGMSEIFIDLFALTGDAKYQETAKRFTHITVVYPLANGEDVLVGRHANDQIPKFVGVAKEYEYSGDDLYRRAAANFWDIVTSRHTVAIGGNSCYERFGYPGEESKRLDFSSAETCNTYNMLKLSRQLFLQSGDVKYLDYYEWALYNHILASQDPCHNGCVTYYTTLMPGGFKQYSTPYESFWCCVGTGLENHAKYGENIYFHNDGNLLVNLFIPSVLQWKEKGFKAHLDTRFPENGNVAIIIDENGTFAGNMMVRVPAWVKDDFQVKKNGNIVQTKVENGYLTLAGLAKGDRIECSFPMTLGVRYVADEPHFGSFTYGPLVLAGDLGTEGMPEDIVSDNRALREEVPLAVIPEFSGDLNDIASLLKQSADQPLHFTAKSTDGKDISFVPYHEMHHRRNSVYWKIYSVDEFKAKCMALTDEVTVGDEANEKAHKLSAGNSVVEWHDFFWAKNRRYRIARDGGSFSYTLKINPKETRTYSLVCRFWGDEGVKCKFHIYVDDTLVADVDLHRLRHLTYDDDVYEIPQALTFGKKKITVKFAADAGQDAGGLYNLKITADAQYR